MTTASLRVAGRQAKLTVVVVPKWSPVIFLNPLTELPLWIFQTSVPLPIPSLFGSVHDQCLWGRTEEAGHLRKMCGRAVDASGTYSRCEEVAIFEEVPDLLRLNYGTSGI